MKEILVVDIETTSKYLNGLIVEIGIVKVDLDSGDKEVVYDAVIKEPGFCEKHQNALIFDISNLEYEDVCNAAPLDFKAIQKFFDQYHATSFNTPFDFGYLRLRGFTFNKLPCLMELATEICKLDDPRYPGEYKWPSVPEAYEWFFGNTGYSEKHRAADDALHEVDIAIQLYRMGVLKVP